MNKNSKAFAKPKLTKRQRKTLRGDNHMVNYCKSAGNKIEGYIGAVPEFFNKNMSNTGLIAEFVKTRKGIPFVLS